MPVRLRADVWGVQAHAHAVRVWGGAHGWNIDYGRLCEPVSSSTFLRPSGSGVLERGCRGWGRLGTLLGPEGTAGRLLYSGLVPGSGLLRESR